MRISDWSSDVCSSDLRGTLRLSIMPRKGTENCHFYASPKRFIVSRHRLERFILTNCFLYSDRGSTGPDDQLLGDLTAPDNKRGRTDRKSVEEGKSRTDRVDQGGSSIIKQKTKHT